MHTVFTMLRRYKHRPPPPINAFDAVIHMQESTYKAWTSALQAANTSYDSPNTSRRLALGARDVCSVCGKTRDHPRILGIRGPSSLDHVYACNEYTPPPKGPEVDNNIYSSPPRSIKCVPGSAFVYCSALLLEAKGREE